METVCPVLSFTPVVREVLAWFQRTHEIEGFGMGGAVWRLRRHPRPGAYSEQDAWLMEALAHARHVSNELLGEKRPATTEKELEQIHQGIREDRTH